MHQEVGVAYLSDVHGKLVLGLAVLVTQRTNKGRAVVFGVLGGNTHTHTLEAYFLFLWLREP